MDSSAFRSVMRSVPTTITVVAGMVDRQPVGMIVGSFQYISTDPMLVGFFGDERSATFDLVRAMPCLSFAILGEDNGQLVDDFRGRVPASRFDGVRWSTSMNGLPIIEDATTVLETTVASTTPAGDHTLLLARVDAVHQATTKPSPLLYQRNELCAVRPIHRAGTGVGVSAANVPIMSRRTW